MNPNKQSIIFNEIFMKTILENMKEIVTVFDINGNVIYLNHAAQDHVNSEYLTCFKSNTLSYEGIYQADGKTLINSNTNPVFRILKGEKVINEEIWIMPKGKPLSILQVNGKPMYDHNQEIFAVLIVFQDITERKWAQQRLSVSEQRYKSLFDHNPDLVCWFDLNGRFLSVNAAAEKITGFKFKELHNQCINQFVSKEAWNNIKTITLKAIKGFSQNFETSIIQKNGNLLLLSITIVPITVESKVVGIYTIAKDITARKKDEQTIHYLAYHDTLTQLPNRRYFQKSLSEYLQDEHKKISILFIDLDRFKLINDTLGHSVGDILLSQVAKRLSNCMEKENTVFRFGGDEFIIILPKAPKEKTEGLAIQILEEFAQPFILNGQEYKITPSIGISVYPTDGQDIDNLVRKADTAMYRAKEQGKNTFKFYSEEMNELIIRRMKIENELHKALEQNQFVIYYQPQVCSNEKIIGMEALIRWQHPELGLVSPAEFIPIAEETGLIVSIGKWVLLNACKHANLWKDSSLPPIRVAVNLSARQFYDEKLVNVVEQALREANLDPMYLELEITESIAMQDGDSVISKLQDLKHLGIKLSIDDFGTGYSSLSYLKKFPFDSLKIDRSFISSITQGSDELAIVKAIIGMAKSLNLKVLAEGVELEEQKNLLFSLGCNELQGFLFGKPVPYEKLKEEFYQSRHYSRI